MGQISEDVLDFIGANVFGLIFKKGVDEVIESCGKDGLPSCSAEDLTGYWKIAETVYDKCRSEIMEKNSEDQDGDIPASLSAEFDGDEISLLICKTIYPLLKAMGQSIHVDGDVLKSFMEDDVTSRLNIPTMPKPGNRMETDDDDFVIKGFKDSGKDDE